MMSGIADALGKKVKCLTCVHYKNKELFDWQYCQGCKNAKANGKKCMLHKNHCSQGHSKNADGGPKHADILNKCEAYIKQVDKECYYV